MTYVDPIEVIWTLAALPGLVLWMANNFTARKSLKAVRLMGVTDGRLIIARYGILKSDVMVVLSLTFLLIGVVSMLRPQNPEVPHWDWLRVALTIGLIGAPFAISFIGWRWRVVDRTILAMARQRQSFDPYERDDETPVLRALRERQEGRPGPEDSRGH